MPTRVSAILFVVLSLLLGACATTATGPSFSEAPVPSAGSDQSVLYIFRSYAEPKLMPATLIMDGKELVTLPQKGFSWVYVTPGKHHFKYRFSAMAGMPVVEFDREMEKGKEYAFAMQGSVGGGVVVTRIAPMRAEAAKVIMMKCCKYVVPTK